MINEAEKIRYLECCELAGKQEAFNELYNEKNQSYEIFKFVALLAAKKIYFGDILEYMGYTEIYVYGMGEIGQMFLDMLDERIKIKKVIDKTNIEDVQFEELDIIKDDLPIIITPSAYFQEISYRLIKLGICRQRIHAIHTILTFAMKYMFSGKSRISVKIPYMQRKQFLITGAQFTNKGAQSMLFTAVSEIRKRFKDAIIWYLPIDSCHIYTKEIKSKYDFIILTDGYDLRAQLYEILTELTAVIDVSGYVLSSLWNHGGWYFRILRFAYRYRIPLYLMPQSFGPFDFSNEMQEELKTYLPSVSHIYAREFHTYQQMKKLYKLENISLSNDLVLQNKEIDENYIYFKSRNRGDFQRLSTINNVALIPNERNCEFTSVEKVLRVYQYFVKALLKKGKNIYLISHSGHGDQKICQDIYGKFESNPAVHLVEEEMNCIDFEMFTTNFQYMIASRYHAIVHGYKNYIPSIAVGWAEKYKELLSKFHQEDYLFDIREEINIDIIDNAVCNMDKFFPIESKQICEDLLLIQAENCFDILETIEK